MGARKTSDILLFNGFRLELSHGGSLCRQFENGVSEPLVIGSRAFELLRILIDRRGELVAKSELLDAVWPETMVEENNLTVQISALRRVLDNGRSAGSCIQTVPGRGYRFVAPVTRVDLTGPSASTPNLSSGGGWPIAETAQPQGPGPPNRPGGVAPISILPPRHRAWRGIVATIAGAAILVAAATVWNWRSFWFAAVDRAPRLSIVVLPFTNLTEDKEQQYFADGINEDLTTDLSRIAGSFVISRNTAYAYKDKPADTKQIGRELGVRYVLEGGVQRVGEQVHLNVQLIDTESGVHIWAERFDTDRANLAATQNEITGHLAWTLQAELQDAAGRQVDQEKNPNARDLVLRGWASSRQPVSEARLHETQRIFEQALQLDSASVDARIGLAMILIRYQAVGFSIDTQSELARAEQLLLEAHDRNGNDPRARFALGWLRRVQSRFLDSRIELERAIALDRNNAYAMIQLGWTLIALCQPEAAIPHIEQAIRLDPRGPVYAYYAALGDAHLLLRHLDQAIEFLRRARAAKPEVFYVHMNLAAALGLRGDIDEAKSALADMLNLKPDYNSFARLAAVIPEFRNPQSLACGEKAFVTGLRRAGLPDE